MYVLYKTINTVNGKFYIGIHKTDDINDDYLGSGKNLKRAIAKYGKDTFSKEIIDIYSCLDDARYAENKIVTESFVCDSNTYNIAIGGGLGGENLNGFTFRHHTHTEVSRDKIRQARLGKNFLTDSGRAAIIVANKENKERKIKISLALAGKPKTSEHKEKIASSIRKLNSMRPSPNKGRSKPMITCIHCGKQGAVHNMYRWHFDNCKNNGGE